MKMEDMFSLVDDRMEARDYASAKKIMDKFYAEKKTELDAMQVLAAKGEKRFESTIRGYHELLSDLEATSRQMGMLITQVQNTSGGQN